MANLSPLPIIQPLDNNGNIVPGGKLYTYAAGTTTPLATYTDASAATENPNPVILDSAGRADIWLGSSAYKYVLKDANDVAIWTKDNISLPTVSNGFTTGDAKLTYKTVADSGWVMANDTSIGNSISGASGRANDDTEELFKLIWNNILDAHAPVSTGRGVSAAADFAANKTLTLPKTLGRALGVAGAGSTLTSRALGAVVGAETHTLDVTQIPSHTHTQNAHNHTQVSHNHAIKNAGGSVANLNAPTVQGIAGLDSFVTGYTVANSASVSYLQSENPTINNTTATNQNTGGDGAHNNMQPTVFLNVMIKL